DDENGLGCRRTATVRRARAATVGKVRPNASPSNRGDPNKNCPAVYAGPPGHSAVWTILLSCGQSCFVICCHCFVLACRARQSFRYAAPVPTRVYEKTPRNSVTEKPAKRAILDAELGVWKTGCF